MTFFQLPAGLLPAVLLAAAPAAAQALSPADARPFARALQAVVGQQANGLTLRTVHAEGNVLVITVDGGTGWRAFVPVAALTQSQLSHYCRRREVRGFFNGRRLLRVDTVELGRNRWRGRPVTRCP